MAAAKIKKGDSVVVRSGKDKGRTGTVLQVMPKDEKVLVQGVNVATRHRKPSQTNPQGGIDRREAPMAYLQGWPGRSQVRQGNARAVRRPQRQEGPCGREVRGDDLMADKYVPRLKYALSGRDRQGR